MNAADGPWLRVMLAPGCWATLFVSREPTADELGTLIRYLRIPMDALSEPPSAPRVPPPPPKKPL